MNTADLETRIDNITDMADALAILNDGPQICQDSLSEYPEAAAYLSALSGYTQEFGTQETLSARELKMICRIVLRSIFYE